MSKGNFSNVLLGVLLVAVAVLTLMVLDLRSQKPVTVTRIEMQPASISGGQPAYPTYRDDTRRQQFQMETDIANLRGQMETQKLQREWDDFYNR